MSRREENERDRQKRLGRYKTFWLAVVFLAFLYGVYRYIEARHAQGLDDFNLNLSTEIFGVVASTGVTLLFLDKLNERRDLNNLKRRLTAEAGSRSNDIAISAVEWMQRECWLRGEDGLLKGADLRKARLMGARLDCANLQGAKLQFANLSGAELKKANLMDASLTGASFEKAWLIGAKLQFADLIGTSLKSANLSKANLQGITMIRTDVEGAIFYQTDLTGATLLEMVNLRGANFSLHQEDILPSGESYEEALKHNANLEGVQLRGADLKDVNIRMLNMKGVDLWLADLRGAKLAGTNLQDANLYGALLEGAAINYKDRGIEFKWTEAPDDGNDIPLFFPKTDFSGATLPDGNTFTGDMDSEAIRQFTDPNHPRFPAKLAEVEQIRDPV